ncbi:MAG: Uncharacterized UPF0721 integral membrane protein [uncultured Solirubrobacteraceae bacterium]|uniref:Probable membrane transporter protein n=1 Tax=uncultured Solirubrobacteraceae bacterium TaxID=1162706 RepID=A0A6J4TU24_9ACTN|nr:MAG: Uncharacterized UPF0721 integral membrane protein [uncultured Solirubrobacteraceae bacterium]
MTFLESVLVLLAGVAAGTINTVVGSGTLITFPTLLAVGYPPVVANVSNTIGLVPGSISGAIGYRDELRGQRGRLLRLASASLLGGLTGGVLLLSLPGEAFEGIVPALIALALVLVLAQPRLTAAVARRRERAGATGRPRAGVPLWLGVFATGIYGGYFGAAQGVLLIAVLGIGLAVSLQRANALKNVLSALVNGVAGLLFIALADVAWAPVALIAAGSIAGGQLGARIGRRLPPAVLRGVILVVGIAAIAQMAL